MPNRSSWYLLQPQALPLENLCSEQHKSHRCPHPSAALCDGCSSLLPSFPLPVSLKFVVQTANSQWFFQDRGSLLKALLCLTTKAKFLECSHPFPQPPFLLSSSLNSPHKTVDVPWSPSTHPHRFFLSGTFPGLSIHTGSIAMSFGALPECHFSLTMGSKAAPCCHAFSSLQLLSLVLSPPSVKSGQCQSE